VTPTRFAIVALVAFCMMEPFTAAAHRYVMHGVGERLHRSHHRVVRNGGVEANDWYPVTFAAMVLVGLWAGFNVDRLAVLVPVGVGVTVYGATYAVVHDVYIHGRLGWFGDRRVAVLDRLADAHRVHHRTGRAPYGMLVPVVPRERRVARSARFRPVD
jgi:beta-carotene 3-hydroxylase